MKLEKIASFGAAGREVGDIVASPNGQFLALLYGEGPSWNASMVKGVTLFRREGAGYVRVAELPVVSTQILVLDDGRCVVVLADYKQIELVRYKVRDDAVEEESRRVELTGLDLFAPTVALLPPGQEVVIGVTDRDDGQGWSEPVYATYWRRIHLLTGETLEGKDATAGYRRFYQAPGRPWASASDGGDGTKLDEIIKGLPWGKERVLRVGSRYLLTNARVIEVLTGATLLGEEKKEGGRSRVFYDLSADERFAVGSDSDGKLELWTVTEQSVATLDLSLEGRVQCAVLLANGELVVGTGSGQALLVGWS